MQQTPLTNLTDAGQAELESGSTTRGAVLNSICKPDKNIVMTVINHHHRHHHHDCHDHHDTCEPDQVSQ